MPEPEVVKGAARAWVAKAEEDFLVATTLLQHSPRCPANAVCFHAQQCIEKYVKAELVWLGTPFPKTHDIENLLSLLPDDHPALGVLTVEQQRRLTTYASMTRYPGDWEPAARQDAESAVDLMERCRALFRGQLPTDVLANGDGQ